MYCVNRCLEENSNISFTLPFSPSPFQLYILKTLNNDVRKKSAFKDCPLRQMLFMDSSKCASDWRHLEANKSVLNWRCYSILKGESWFKSSPFWFWICQECWIWGSGCSWNACRCTVSSDYCIPFCKFLDYTINNKTLLNRWKNLLRHEKDSSLKIYILSLLVMVFMKFNGTL